MDILGEYQTFMLFEVSEHDIAASGGGGESRYLRNRVLVFEKGGKIEMGSEIWAVSDVHSAKKKVDESRKKKLKNSLDEAVSRSAEVARKEHIRITKDAARCKVYELGGERSEG